MSRVVPSLGMPVFLADLRTLMFASMPKATEYFALKSHTTIMRYESGKIVPPAGYLAALARLVAERLGRSGSPEHVQMALLREVNAALLCCSAGEGPFETWLELCHIADEFIGKHRLALIPTKGVPKAGTVAPYSRTHHLRPNPLFVGRDAALQTIGTWLAQESPSAPPVYVISGMAGLGKSQLAVEAIHRYGPFFAGGVFWLSFADVGAVPAEVAECGRAEHLDLRPDFAGLSLDDQVRLVRAAWQEPLPRLLIFDNCEDEQELDTWRPSHGGCRIIVTSRRSRWNPALAVHAQPLEVLERPASIALLRHYRPDLADNPVLDAIAATLGDLPLALHLAGSYLHTYEDAAHAYLAQLQAARLVAHPSLQAADRPFSPTAHQQHIGDTIGLSYERLNIADPIDSLARTIFGRLACFAPGESVPRLLLDETCAPDEMSDLDAAIQRLAALALVRVEDNDAIWMHRLVADFVHAHAFDPAAQALVEAALVRVVTRYQDVDDNSTLISLQPHMRWVTDAALPRRDHQAVELCYCLSYHLWQIAAFDEAQRHLAGMREWLQTADDAVGLMDLTRVTELLGLVFQMKGQHAAAKVIYQEVLALRIQVVGPEHIETATSHNNLGHVLHVLNELDDAWFHLQKAVRLRRQLLGIEYVETARSINNLGYVLMHRGRYAAAECLFRFALGVRQRRIAGPAVVTSQSLNNVGDACAAQGRYDKAMMYHQRALAMRQAMFIEAEPSIAESTWRVGQMLAAQHQFADALATLERALAIEVSAVGPNHIEAMMITACLGAVLRDLGRYDEARAQLEPAVAQLSAQFGTYHFWALDASEELCRLDLVTGRWAAARLRAEWLVATPQNPKGKPHPRIVTAHHLLGQTLEGQGDAAAALAHYERALALAPRLLGHAHPQIGAIQRSVDAAYDKVKRASQ